MTVTLYRFYTFEAVSDFEVLRKIVGGANGEYTPAFKLGSRVKDKNCAGAVRVEFKAERRKIYAP